MWGSGRTIGWALILLLACLLAADTLAEPGLSNPVAVAPFLDGIFPPRTPLAPGSSNWDVGDAFPALPLQDTLVIASNPGDSRLYVARRDGLIVSFENTESAAVSEPFLDLTDRVAVVYDGGFLGLAFHPQFGQGTSAYGTSFYVYYTSFCPTDSTGKADAAACNPGYPTGPTQGFFGVWLRLSRFEAVWDAAAGVWRGDPSSEEPMINVRLYNDGHRGGNLAFSLDGHLYLSIGEQFRFDTAQDIAQTFEGGIFRFAVDVVENGDGNWTCPPASHAPRRLFQDVSGNVDERSGRLYCIPDDNPWLDPAGSIFEEYFSIGHRNPYRIAVDPVTGFLWVGEVGAVSREEINVIQKGGNYGWPFREGLVAGPFAPPQNYIGTLTDPVIDFTREEALAIIGGYVYRGDRFPELQGQYIAGDYVTRNIWAIDLDPNTMTATKTLLTSFDPGSLVTFGQDQEGEILLGSLAHTPLQRLERIGDPVPDPPAALSALGAFVDLERLAPHPAAIPYDVVPFWSDGAAKSRWIFVPNDGIHDQPDEKILFSADDNWQFPVGTVLMKHFELPLDEADPSRTVRLETRFLVRGDDGDWYGVTYRWNEDQQDARLLTTSEQEVYVVQTEGGGSRQQTWTFPARETCLTCHSPATGGALGPRTHQLNRPLTYPASGVTDNQLATWNALGIFEPSLEPSSIPTLPASARLDEIDTALEHRARSWLDTNCSYCHRPGTGNRATFDARLTTPLANQGLIWGAVSNALEIPDAHLVTPGLPLSSIVYHRAAALGSTAMPPIAKTRVDTRGVALLYDWILRIDPLFPRPGLLYEYFELEGLIALPHFDSLVPTASGTVADFDLSPRQRDDDFAFRFTGFVEVEVGGDWTFFTTSDDGSQLFIDGTLVVDNDGLHGAVEQSGTIALSAGFHEISVLMFEAAGDEVLEVRWEGPGIPKSAISRDRLWISTTGPPPNNPPVLAELGEQSHREGEVVSVDVGGSDADGDLLLYEASGLPEGLEIDASTGEIAGVIEHGATGTYAVMVAASDGAASSSVEATWFVPEPYAAAGSFAAIAVLGWFARRPRAASPSGQQKSTRGRRPPGAAGAPTERVPADFL